jgi:cell division protein FtsB
MRHSLITKKKSWFQSPWVAILLLFMVVWGIVAVIRAYTKQREAIALRDGYVRELDQMKQKETELSAKIDSLSEVRGMEAEVRERYRVVKPGEQLVVIVDNKEGADTSVDQKTFWQKLRQFVGL